MRTYSSEESKNKFEELIDLAIAARVVVTKYDQPVAVVMTAEDCGRGDGIRTRGLLHFKQ